MADYNSIYSFGQISDFINTVIEIGQGSTLKIEYRKDKKTFELDRVEPSIFPKPCNYGFIPQTLDDELDTLVVCSEVLPMGLVLQAKVIGVLNFEDDGEMDHKIVCVPADNRDNDNMITTVDQLGERWKQQIEYHFNHYKDLKKPGTTKVLGWGNVDDAWKIIQSCADAFSK
jgi:inorganic pyrophosphatase